MSDTSIPLMAHLVAGYPDESGCLAVAEGLVAGGATYLEVQIPFSDPSADGPAILNACSKALEGGWNVKKSLDFIGTLSGRFPSTPVFIMSYTSPVLTPGVATFVKAAAKRKVAGLIVPDLPFDSDEGLAEACEAGGLCSIPVAAPSMRPERLDEMAGLGREYLYAALRAGITGSETHVGDDTLAFLDRARAGGSKILGGFGIKTGAQARVVAPHVHAVVAGSVFVETITRVLAEHAAKKPDAYKANIAARDEALREAVKKVAEGIVKG